MKLIDLVIFDMAGTTVKDEKEVEDCFWQAAEKTGIKTSHEKINSMMGWSKRLVFETLWKEQLREDQSSELLIKTEQSYQIFKEILEHHYKTHEVKPTEGALEIFQYLKKNQIRIGLTTGFYREVTDIILNKLQWTSAYSHNPIDICVASDEVSLGRPYPYMVFKIMESLKVMDVKKVVKIGDTPSDLGEGKNAGCLFSFGITNGTHTQEELTKFTNDGLFQDLTKFQTFLEEYLE